MVKKVRIIFEVLQYFLRISL